MNLTSTLQTVSLPRRLGLQVGAVLAFALLTALAARIAIPIPGTPVPVTLQSFMAVVAAVILGPALGAASMTLYLLLGLAGLDVFAAAEWSLGRLLGATGGYLVGFILCQPVVGRVLSIAPNRAAGFGRLLLAFAAGEAVILASGLLWMVSSVGTDLSTTLRLGLVPFVPATLLKIAVGAALVAWGRARWGRRSRGGA
jgi:biotin transport system substrate-specific component